MAGKSTFGTKARGLAAQVAAGNMTQAEAEAALKLEPGEHLSPTGVVTGSGAHPETPRFGAEETDQDGLAEPWASLYAVADLMDQAGE